MTDIAEIVQHPAAVQPKATFDRAVRAYLPEAMAICTDRGAAYGDTWALENCINTFKSFVLALPGHPSMLADWLRLLQVAALIDTKQTRLLGGFKRDHVIDGINYLAMFGFLMEEYQLKLDQVLAATSALAAKAAEATLPTEAT